MKRTNLPNNLFDQRLFFSCACGQPGDHDHGSGFKAEAVTPVAPQKPLKSTDELRKDAVTHQLAASFDLKL